MSKKTHKSNALSSMVGTRAYFTSYSYTTVILCHDRCLSRHDDRETEPYYGDVIPVDKNGQAHEPREQPGMSQCSMRTLHQIHHHWNINQLQAQQHSGAVTANYATFTQTQFTQQINRSASVENSDHRLTQMHSTLSEYQQTYIYRQKSIQTRRLARQRGRFTRGL